MQPIANFRPGAKPAFVPARAIAARPAEALPADADVVIAGAGIMGCAAAYYLAKRGIKALVFDKSGIAEQQSTRSWGFVRQQARDPVEVPLMQASIALWKDLEAELRTDLQWRQGGCLYAADSEREMADFEAWMSVAQQHGLDTRLLSPDQVRQQMPGLATRQHGGLFTPSDGQAEPRLVAPALARRASELGARFVEQCGVNGVETGGGAVLAVNTEQGRVRTRRFICAAGVDSYRVLRQLGIALPQQQVRGTVSRTTPGPDLGPVSFIGHGIGIRQRSDGSFNLADGIQVDVDVTLGHLRGMQWFMGPLLGQHRAFAFRLNRAFVDDLAKRVEGSAARGADGLMGERAPAAPPSERRVRNSLAALHEAFPAQREVRVVESWGGYIDVLPDGIPVIDAPASPRGLLVATGFCGHGFAMGPIVGKLLADWLATGEPGFDLKPLRLSRYAERDVKPPYSLF